MAIEQIAPGRHHYTLAEAFSLSRPTRVLFAEDDIEMRQFVSAALRREGYDVLAVDNGEALLREVLAPSPSDAGVFQMVLSDVRMPGLSGLQVLAEMRERHRSTPVVLVTAFGDEATHARAAQLGAAVLDKPFELHALCAALLSMRLM